MNGADPVQQARTATTCPSPNDLSEDAMRWYGPGPDPTSLPMVTQGLTMNGGHDVAARTTLPIDSAARKATPIATGVLDYFPAALAAVAQVSKAGNDKHNPGEPLHHSRGKSTDHADSMARHLIDRGGIDPDTGQRHSAELAWRALANLQQELEDAGEAPLARGARYDDGSEREEHSKPVTVADLQSREDFNAGVQAAIKYLENGGWHGLAEDLEDVKVR